MKLKELEYLLINNSIKLTRYGIPPQQKTLWHVAEMVDNFSKGNHYFPKEKLLADNFIKGHHYFPKEKQMADNFN